MSEEDTEELKNFELMAYCYSSKEGRIGPGAGIDFECKTAEEAIEKAGNDLDWLYVNLGESFWETYDEFDIDGAKLIAAEKEIDFSEALREIYGTFSLKFFLNDKPITFAIDSDPDDLIMDMIIDYYIED